MLSPFQNLPEELAKPRSLEQPWSEQSPPSLMVPSAHPGSHCVLLKTIVWSWSGNPANLQVIKRASTPQ